MIREAQTIRAGTPASGKDCIRIIESATLCLGTSLLSYSHAWLSGSWQAYIHGFNSAVRNVVGTQTAVKLFMNNVIFRIDIFIARSKIIQQVPRNNIASEN